MRSGVVFIGSETDKKDLETAPACSRKVPVMQDFANEFRTNPHSGVWVSEKLAHWKPLLKEWCKIQKEFCQSVPSDQHDAIFVHHELSQVSSLASAAWRLEGWTALQEWRCFGSEGTFYLTMKNPQAEEEISVLNQNQSRRNT